MHELRRMAHPGPTPCWPQSTRHTEEHVFRKAIVQHLSTAVLKAPVLADVLCHHSTNQLFGLQKTQQDTYWPHTCIRETRSLRELWKGPLEGQARQKINYLLCTEPDPQCEEDPLQVSPVQVATPVGIKKHKSQKAVQGEHS